MYVEIYRVPEKEWFILLHCPGGSIGIGTFTYIYLVDFHGKCRQNIPIPWILRVIVPHVTLLVTFGMVSKIG